MEDLLFRYLTKLATAKKAITRSDLNYGLAIGFSFDERTAIIAKAIKNKLIVETKIPGNKEKGRGYTVYSITEKGKNILNKQGEYLKSILHNS